MSDHTTGDEQLDSANDEELISIYQAYAKSKRTRDCRYSNEYLDLLNDQIALAAEGPDAERLPLEPSQVGATTWTSIEKDTLFAGLTSFGRHDFKRIADAIGSKSEYEVTEYLSLLRAARHELASRISKDGRPLTALDLPAACELSEDCEDALEVAADAIAWDVEKSDQAKEQKRHGRYWLLDDQVAAQVECEIARAPPSDTHESANPVAAAELLHLGNWLELTEVLVRHDTDYDNLWTFQDEFDVRQLSIFHTAFNDFHSLAMSLTRRLVQATIFQATSRLRALDVVSRRRAEEVRHQDVYAAAQVLGLSDDWSGFWIGCARRNNLQIHTRAKMGHNFTVDAAPSDESKLLRWLEFDDVERVLRRKQVDHDDPAPTIDTEHVPNEIASHLDYLQHQSDSEYWTDEDKAINTLDGDATKSTSEADASSRSDSEAESSSDSEVQSEGQAPRYNHNDHKAITRAHRLHEDLAIATHDRQESKRVENDLWAMLHQRRPVSAPTNSLEGVTAPDEGGLGPKLRGAKRQLEGPEDLIDWRDRTQYAAPWTHGPGRVPADAAFAAVAVRGQSAKRRRLEAMEMLSGSEGHIDRHDHELPDHGIEQTDSVSEASSSADPSADTAMGTSLSFSKEESNDIELSEKESEESSEVSDTTSSTSDDDDTREASDLTDDDAHKHGQDDQGF